MAGSLSTAVALLRFIAGPSNAMTQIGAEIRVDEYPGQRITIHPFHPVIPAKKGLGKLFLPLIKL
jgi:hypothetical protein